MSDPSADDISAVRFLIGDPDGGTGTTTQLSDAEIQFALDQAGTVYGAAAGSARALAARYARRVDTQFETISSKYSQLHANYLALAREMDKEAKKRGALGIPIAGGIRITEMDAVRADNDRVKPFFRENLFNNPPAPNE